MATTKKTEIENIENIENVEQVENISPETVAASEIAPAETVVAEKIETPSVGVNLSKVAGFKAVDAEGNELGVVTMQELQDAIATQVLQTISMRQQAATLEEPALLSASAQSAGSDTYENQLPEQTDLKWARALDASGNPILISKESLASVVGGRLDVSALKLRTYHLENGATIDTGISQKGLVVIGNNDYYYGDISVFMNNHSSAEPVYLGSNRTPHIKVFKDARDSNMKITNESNGYALDVYIRIYPLL